METDGRTPICKPVLSCVSLINLFFAFIKRNAKAFALNAIVDIRRRRAVMIGLLISRKTIRASNFKIGQNVVHKSLYISIGNDVIAYLWSAENRVNVFIFGHVQLVITR